MDDAADVTEDNFKKVFKYYKRKNPPPNFKDVLHLDDTFQGGHKWIPKSLSDTEQEAAESLGLVPPDSWRIFSFNSHPDLLLIQNPFSPDGQLKWIEACLKEYPRNPNKSNLESCNVTLSDSSWWDIATSADGKKKELLKKLRWVTLGYHHNWETKEYSEKMRGVMPQDLKMLCSLVAKVSGFPDFVAEATIVNFYHEDSSLGPHTDHSEPNMSAPLLSFSFGQSAVFLIGGPTKQTKPTAIFLHSGDILLMTGATRQAFHAVPRIVLVKETPWIPKILDDIDSESDRSKLNLTKDICDYVKKSRININVRQVLLPTMESLS